MRFTKRAISMVMVTILSSSLLAACGSGDSSTSTQGTTTAKVEGQVEVSTDKEVKKPDNIHWMVHDGMTKENGTDLWVEEFEKLTEIDLNLEIVSNNEYSTILELAFASGQVPDLFDLSGDNISIYAKQGAIADLTDLVKNSSFYDEVDPGLWESITVDGRIYGVPKEVPSGAVTYIRKDWLDRLEMEVPTTYEEFITMLTRFKNEIPECTVPLTAPGLSNAMNLPEFYQGATSEFTKVNGVWIDGMGQDNMGEALQRLREAYSTGLIDMEVVTNTTSNCRDQWYSGSVGVFNYWGGNWGQTLTERLQINVPEAEVIAIDPIEGAVYEFSTPSILCINSNLSEEEIESLFKYFMEYIHDGGEGQVLFQSGVEGVHWEQSGNELVPLPSLSNPEETFRKAWVTPWLGISPLKVTDKELEIHEAVTDSLAVINKYGVNKMIYPISSTLTRIKSDLELIKQEVIAKVVMSEMTVEEGMEKYRSTAEMLDVEQVLAEMNQ